MLRRPLIEGLPAGGRLPLGDHTACRTILWVRRLDAVQRWADTWEWAPQEVIDSFKPRNQFERDGIAELKRRLKAKHGQETSE